MKKIFVKCYVIILLGTSAFSLKAQDPQVTQFFATPVYTNPAMTGTAFCHLGEPGGRFAMNYRNQWPGLPGTFRTMVAGWDQHFDALGGGLGLMFTRDVAGTGKLSRTTIHADYSYLIPLGRSTYMRLGMEAALFRQGIDYARLKFGDQIEQPLGFVNPTGEVFSDDQKTYPNFSAGALVYTENFYAGVASHNITEPNQSFVNDPYGRLPRRYTAHAGVTIPLGSRRNVQSSISPNALFMMQDNFTQINFGMYLNKGPLVTGLWFRQSVGEAGNSDALMALIGFRKDRFKFGYSYDITVSKARSAVYGSHEVSAAVDWCVPKGKRSFNPIDCPDF